MLCACFITEGTSMCIPLPIRVPLIAGDSRGHWLDQHGGMATVAEAPAGAEVNREGALMVAAVNGTIDPQSFPRLDRIDQIAGRHEVNHVSSAGRMSGDGHVLTPSQDRAHGPRQHTPTQEQAGKRCERRRRESNRQRDQRIASQRCTGSVPGISTPLVDTPNDQVPWRIKPGKVLALLVRTCSNSFGEGARLQPGQHRTHSTSRFHVRLS